MNRLVRMLKEDNEHIMIKVDRFLSSEGISGLEDQPFVRMPIVIKKHTCTTCTHIPHYLHHDIQNLHVYTHTHIPGMHVLCVDTNKNLNGCETHIARHTSIL